MRERRSRRILARVNRELFERRNSKSFRFSFPVYISRRGTRAQIRREGISRLASLIVAYRREPSGAKQNTSAFVQTLRTTQYSGAPSKTVAELRRRRRKKKNFGTRVCRGIDGNATIVVIDGDSGDNRDDDRTLKKGRAKDVRRSFPREEKSLLYIPCDRETR